jgi:hypothetical protein
MCADTNNKPSSSDPSAKPESIAEKVRSSRYEWELETASAERRQKPRQLLKRSRLAATVIRFFRTLLNPERNPFDSDDGPDPMTA